MNHSENLESTYSPLSGGDRVKVISFFTLLILPFAWFGLSVPVILIIGIAIYIMKKDKSFSPILKSKKWIKIYFILLGIIVVYIAVHREFYYYINSYHEYYKFLDLRHLKEYINYQIFDDIPQGEPLFFHMDYLFYEIEIVIVELIVIPIGTWILIFIFNFLFFNPLEEHQEWVVKNGIFADKEKAINIIDKDNGKFYSVADELIKWNDLLDKGLITQEEFEEQKKKILNK
jgi:hypothetical protein